MGPIKEDLVPMATDDRCKGLLQPWNRIITPVARIDPDHHTTTTGLTVANDLSDAKSWRWLVDGHEDSYKLGGAHYK